MQVKTFTRPNIRTIYNVLFFQIKYLNWKPDEIEALMDRYGSAPIGYVICYEKDKIVGVANLLKRRIKYKSKSVLLGGLGGVCTRTEYRRKGVASKIIKRGIVVLKESKCDVAYLNTDLRKYAALYEKLGFVALKRDYRATGPSGEVYEDDSGMIAPVCSKKLFEQILNDKEIFDLQGQDW